MFSDAERLWVVHIGHSDTLALRARDEGFICIGWPEMGDLRRLQTRQDFKDAMKRTYPGTKPASLNSQYGQVYRFVRAMQVGDPVVFPVKPTKEICIGRIAAEYEGPSDDPQLISEGSPNCRNVEWLKIVPRTVFSQKALYSFGSFSTISTSDDHLDEVIAVLEGEQTEPPVGADDALSRLGPEAEDAEQFEDLYQKALEFTEDYLLKQWQGTGHAFEHVVAAVLEALGYTAKVTRASGDHGVDVIAHRDRLGLEPPVLKVQAKSGAGTVGSPAVNQLKGTLHPGEKGMVVALGGFTNDASAVSLGAPNIILVDGSGFVELFLDAYDNLSAKWQAQFPLEAVHVPRGPVA